MPLQDIWLAFPQYCAPTDLVLPCTTKAREMGKLTSDLLHVSKSWGEIFVSSRPCSPSCFQREDHHHGLDSEGEFAPHASCEQAQSELVVQSMSLSSALLGQEISPPSSLRSWLLADIAYLFT